MARKRKKGDNRKRTQSGQLSRAGMGRVLPNERAQAAHALYGPDGCDAIGRAYQSGLLGDGANAKAMLDTARAISKAYWAAYQVGPITCTFGGRSSGGMPEISPEKVREREEWLSGTLDRVNALGRSYRAYFDQLVVDVHPDSGPVWLDRLCFASRSQSMITEAGDMKALGQAMQALAQLARVDVPPTIMRRAA